MHDLQSRWKPLYVCERRRRLSIAYLPPRPLVGSDDAVPVDVEAAEGGDRAHPLRTAQAVVVILVEESEAELVLGGGPGAPQALGGPELRGLAPLGLVVEFQPG